ncbi:MAG TPA: hypothetical protein VMI10_24720 [Terriglobales bacterium]|nr:hypothetical protein [Terriglobales bacterium]
MSDTKEKPPMYSYVSDWTIARAQWADMEKGNASDEPILSKALAAGTLIGYGNDSTLMHQPDASTHDDWWSSMSLAGLLNVLEQFYKAGNATSPVLEGATKHSDSIYVSRHYNWHSGSWKGVYTRVSTYKLKADAPDDAVEVLSKNLFVPVLEKLMADGVVHEYEIDEEAFHTEAPGTIMIAVIMANAEGLDKYNAAVRDAVKASPLAVPALGSMVDFNPHRDYLLRTNATFK